MPLTHQTTIQHSPVAGHFPKCLEHSDEELKFLCQSHDTTCCVACTVLLHNVHTQCVVVYIPDFAKNYKTGHEYIELSKNLNKTQQLAGKYLTDIEKKMKIVEQLKTKETTKLEKYRTELKECVDKQINELTSQVEQLHDTDMTLLKGQQTLLKNIESNTATTMSKLQACEQTPCELFTESRNVQTEVAQQLVDLAVIAATARCQMYTVHKDEQIETLLQNEDRLATIELTTDQSMTGMRVCFQYFISTCLQKICISKHIINYISCRVTNTDSVFLNLFFC